MAILGKIRQRSIILIIVIAMALFAFVISGVITQPGISLASIKPIATVNDEDIKIDYFRSEVEQFQRRTPRLTTMQAVNYVYSDLTLRTIMGQEYNHLGIDIGPDQLEKLLRSNDEITGSPEFQNELGEFDFGKFRQYVSDLRNTNQASYNQWNNQEKSLVSIAKLQLYSDLVKSGSIFSSSHAKLFHKLENDNVNIEYILIPYDHVDDSLVDISDEEIEKYYQKNKEEFQEDPYRSVHFAVFQNEPTDADKEIIRVRLESLKDQRISYNDVSKLTDTILGFSQTQEVREFVDLHSEVPFDSIYQAKGELSSEYADLLFGLEIGEIFGPYEDENDFKLSRVVDKKVGGNVRASHILISHQGAQNAEEDMLRSKEQAENIARDLLRQARLNPSEFEELAEENSDGPTATRGGDLGFFKEGDMVDEFYAFCRENPVGTIGMIETIFGYHVIRVTEKDDLILLANIVAEIVPSNETSNEIFRSATQFEMDVKQDPSRFVELADESQIEYTSENQIYPLDQELGSLDQTREAIQWAFDKKTKVNQIQRFDFSGGYVVVQLTDINPDGTPKFDQVSNKIERILEEDKKAQLIQQWYGDAQTLEDLAAQDQEFEINPASALNQRNATIVGAGDEPKVVGAAFGIEENEISDLIRGNEGMYKIKVLTFNPTDDLDDYQSYAISLSNRENEGIMEQLVDALQNKSDIKDNRLIYY
ncbi:MAG: peptidylprolyl isomerase [Flavobacteriaceae bacterium]|nr:peptidylprolyl isomerase [Flavobacteriaceae bacterium]